MALLCRWYDFYGVLREKVALRFGLRLYRFFEQLPTKRPVRRWDLT